MNELLKIKEIIRLNECRKIEDTEILVGVFNFSNGNIDRYKFVVQYVKKIAYTSGASEKGYPNHVVLAFGIVKYDDGASYKVSYKLTYTTAEELEKLVEPIKNGIVKDAYEATKMYI